MSLFSRTAATLLLLGMLSGHNALADDDAINSIMGGNEATSVEPIIPRKNKKELWIRGKKPIDHLQIIGAHPLPGENCRQVIFDARPSVKSRFEAKKNKSVRFKLKRLCLLGLRNDSDQQAFVVRIGEALESLAITPDPDLFTGMVLDPHQQIMIPIRPLPVGVLNIPVELVWKSDVNKDNPKIDKVTITITK